MPWRQLDLLKGKRQKGTLPKGPSEFEIHVTVADYLRNGLAPGWLWHHPANGGERPAFINKSGKRVSFEGSRLQRMGVVPGVSDLLLYKAPGAQLHALELKRKGERPSNAQSAWLDDVRLIGGKAEWADNVDDAMKILEDWGAIRTRQSFEAG
jgi:hypothetical protein